jgi:hypothetical protein
MGLARPGPALSPLKVFLQEHIFILSLAQRGRGFLRVAGDFGTRPLSEKGPSARGAKERCS